MTNKTFLIIFLSLILASTVFLAVHFFYNQEDSGKYISPIVSQKLAAVTTQTYQLINRTIDQIVTPPPEPYGLTREQRGRADSLVSLFENDTISIQYDYIEDIGDGRGYTAGRSGFTTKYSDFYMVVKSYSDVKPDNPLAKYLPRLKELVDSTSGSTSGLNGIDAAWKESSKDPLFRRAQDEVTDKLYYNPAMKYASNLGVNHAITKAFLYDTIIQHGDGTDPDSISSLIKKTNAKMGGSPKDGVNEIDWLYSMIEIRTATLKNATNKETREAWSRSTDRCNIFKQIADSGNYDFKKGINVNGRDHKAIIP